MRLGRTKYVMRTQSILKGRFTVLPGVEYQKTGDYIWIVHVTEHIDGTPKIFIRKGTHLFASAPDALDDASMQALRIAAALK
ncbi:MAG: hypothetical protein CBHOC_4394 [uncultured Caballeronia sp.]|nr:MAG: hypothetical protein CBHOC_4394 [uncultured Caballeronia sp.]